MPFMNHHKILEAGIEASAYSIVVTTADLDLPGPSIVYVNPAFTHTTGYTREQAIGATPRILQGPATDRAVLDRLKADLRASGSFQGASWMYARDGTPYRMEWTITSIRLDGETIDYYLSVQRDVTQAFQDQKKLENETQRLNALLDSGCSILDRTTDTDNHRQYLYEEPSAALTGADRALRTLQASNEVLVRAADEDELLEHICQVVVDEDRYVLAWVGFVHAGEDPGIAIEAKAGQAEYYIGSMDLCRRESGDGPAWRTIDSGETQIVPDFASEAVVERRGLKIQDYQLASVITLPLCPQTGAPGVLTIYSRHTDDFHGAERDVLEHLAANIEYGIDALRTARERDHQNQVVADLAYTDALTGLANRNFLSKRLAELLHANHPSDYVATLFIDLDGFKIINDALGHHTGDAVLRQVAQRLQQILRGEDFVARQGGDEFLVVLAEPPRSEEWRNAAVENNSFAEAARMLARRLVERLSEPVIIEGRERRLGASIGISLYPEHADSAAELIDCADTAMYKAKNEDSHVQIYSDAIWQQRQQRLSFEDRLYAAFDAGEFKLHYQPVFDLASGVIEGVEALLRWPQADGSYVSPSDFIPVAEETGLIRAMGDWVLRTAIAQRAAWLRAGHDLRMAVNVSVWQLRNPDAVGGLLEAVDQALDPIRIEIEVTESGLMDDSGQISEILETLHARGVGIAVDDFGTGHSSLSRLQAMPITTLKIDKSFVAELETDNRGAVITRTVQQLADALGLCALAEGVETDAQRR